MLDVLALRMKAARGICDMRDVVRCGRVCCFNGFAAEVEKAADMVVEEEANRGAARARRQVARDARSVAMVSVDVVK